MLWDYESYTRFPSSIVGMSAAAFVSAEDTPAAALLVLAKSDNMLSIVDPASLKVIARMPVGNDPHEVIASSDGKLAYVSNYGSGAFNNAGSRGSGRA